MTVLSLFAGGGAKTLGAKQAGFTPVGAVEIDADIAACYAQNVSPLITVASVLDVSPKPYEGVDLLMASPPCQQHSCARSKRLPTRADFDVGLDILRWARAIMPRFVLIENVPPYQHTDSFQRIVAGLEAMGYFVDYAVLNSADFGVPQTRRRLILRACRDSMIPSLPSPTRHIGWYEAIEDLLPTLPESRFADWQLRRLNPEMMTPLLYGVQGESGERNSSPDSPSPTITANHAAAKYRAFLAHPNDMRSFPCPPGEKPAFTISTFQYGKPRAWLEQGRVVSLTARALARFQTFPDSYELPAKNELACKIIGNALPCEMARRLCAGFLL